MRLSSTECSSKRKGLKTELEGSVLQCFEVREMRGNYKGDCD